MSPKMLIISGERLVGDIDVSFDTIEEAAKALRKASDGMKGESKKSQDVVDLHNLADDLDRSNPYLPRYCKDCGYSRIALNPGKKTLLRKCPSRPQETNAMAPEDAICENPEKFSRWP